MFTVHAAHYATYEAAFVPPGPAVSLTVVRVEAPDEPGKFDSEGARAEVEDRPTDAASSGGSGGNVVAMAGVAEATMTAYDATVMTEDYVGRAA